MTWDSSKKCEDITLSNSDRTATLTTQPEYDYASVLGVSGRSTGKWYFEVQLTQRSDSAHAAGIAEELSEYCDAPYEVSYIWMDKSGGCVKNGDYVEGTFASWDDLNDRLQVAVDFSSGKIWFGKNGTWMNSGNPAGGTGEITTFTTGDTYYPLGSLTYYDSTGTRFVGSFTEDDLTYEPPSGFLGWEDEEESGVYDREVTEDLGLDDQPRYPVDESASDAVSGDDAIVVAYGKSEAEDLACDDAIPSSLYLGQLVAQTLGISPELAPKVIQIVALASTSGLSDDPIIGFGASPSDEVGMDDAFLAGVGQVLAATLGVGPSLGSLLKTSLAAGDEVGADDSTRFSFDLLAEDALQAAEDLALLLVFDEFLTDTAAADDAPAAAVGLISVVSDALGVDEVPSTLIAAIESVSETAALGGVLRFPDAEYVAWVVNSENLALSRYSGYAFNSMAAFQNTYLGATDTGIYELEGADDAGTDIDARIRTGLMEFGSSRQKAMPAAYLGYTADGSLGLKVTTTDGGTRTETWYKLTETKDAPDTARLRIGKGLKARYWGFELMNVDSADFAVDHLHLYPVVLTRRI